MSTTQVLKFAGRETTLIRSDDLVALCASPGRQETFEDQLSSREIRRLATHCGMIGNFELLELCAGSHRQNEVCGEIAHMRPGIRQAPVYYTSTDGVPFVPIGTIYLSFVPGARVADINAVLVRHALVALRAESGGYVTVGTRADPVLVSARLQDEHVVAVAEPDLVTLRQPFQLSDRLFDRHWHLNNTGSHAGRSFGYKAGADARVVEAWYALGNRGSDAAIIGIIDDGFDFRHPDLRGKEVLPWDATRSSPDLAAPDTLAEMSDRHGTACAGVAAGRAEAGDIVGAAPNARIMPVRIGPDLRTDELARAFGYLSANGAWVVSCSWGPAAALYPMSQRIANAISDCARRGRGGKGAAVLFAAGNSNVSINDATHYNGFAVHPDVIAISSSTSLDQRSDMSNFGREISVCAPSGGGGGWAIVTDDVSGSPIVFGEAPSGRHDPADYYARFGGTSGSCALVAGICALILSAAPHLSPGELRSILERTARRIGDPENYDASGHSQYFGYGCINAAAAVAAARVGFTG